MVSIWIGSFAYLYPSLFALGFWKDSPYISGRKCRGFYCCLASLSSGSYGYLFSRRNNPSLLQLVLQLGHKKLMGRTNYIHLIEQLYRANPKVEDKTITLILQLIGNYEISQGTIQVWKTKMRKKRIAIPDRRKK